MNTHTYSPYISPYLATLGSKQLATLDFANMDEYLRDIVDDVVESVVADDIDVEIYEEFEDEDIAKPTSFIERVYKRVLEEFPDYDSENGPRKVLGWTIAKRRRIRENVKNFKDNRLMRCAVAATCKTLYNVNAKRCDLEEVEDIAKRQLHFKDAPSTKKVWEVLVREWS